MLQVARLGEGGPRGGPGCSDCWISMLVLSGPVEEKGGGRTCEDDSVRSTGVSVAVYNKANRDHLRFGKFGRRRASRYHICLVSDGDNGRGLTPGRGGV